MQAIDIPVDVYSSPTEFVIVMPLWWVNKSSVSLKLENTRLTISWLREAPVLKSSLVPQKETCFRWPFQKAVELPANSYFNNIHSELSKDNILTVIVPKVFVPEELVVTIK